MPAFNVCHPFGTLIAANRLHTLVAIVGCALSGCAADEPDLGETESAISVGGTGGCSTSAVLGLAKQIAAEVDCASSPATLAHFGPTTHIRFASSAVLPYLGGTAKADLVRASQSGTLIVTSGYRTLPQQYLLYRWFREGRCGISKAATPGTSNHESARAVDLSNWSLRRGAMARHHWAHDVAGDPVHFDHLSSPDIRGRDVRAFQRLWNRNHPGDKIAVDGDYGPATAARLRRSPAKGFAKGATCRAPAAAELVGVEGDDMIAPASVATFTLTIANGGVADWPADAKLVVASATASELYDPATWESPTVVGALGAIVPAGGDATIDVQIATPGADEDTPVAETFAIVAGGMQLGAVDFAVTVSPSGGGISMETDDDVEPDPTADPDGVVDRGGCSAGGAAGWLLLALPAALRRRARTRSASRAP